MVNVGMTYTRFSKLPPIPGGSFEKLTVAQYIPLGEKKVNLWASEERNEAILAATNAVSGGAEQCPNAVNPIDRLAVPRDAIYLQTS